MSKMEKRLAELEKELEGERKERAELKAKVEELEKALLKAQKDIKTLFKINLGDDL